MNNINKYKKRFYNLMESTMGDAKPLINEDNTEWKNVTNRFIQTKGSDFKSVDSNKGTWNNAKVMKTQKYEYIQGESSKNGAIMLYVRSNGTWAMAHQTTDGSYSYYAQGPWKWDGSKIIFERGITKNIKGVFTDSDTDMIKSVYTENKVGNIGARGPIVKQIQNILINHMLINKDPTNDPVDYKLIKSITKDFEGCKSDWNKCDGVYGQATKNLLKLHQSERYILILKSGNYVDGIWGKETMTYFKNEYETLMSK
jgi:hypothetical protein